jgi:hypothetical protein
LLIGLSQLGFEHIRESRLFCFHNRYYPMN